MEKKLITEEIIDLLEIIIKQSKLVCAYKNQIPQIEMDIMLTNIRELYQKYKTLDKINMLVLPQSIDVKAEIITEAPAKTDKSLNVVEENTPVISEVPEITDNSTLPDNPAVLSDAPQTKEHVAEVKPLQTEEKQEITEIVVKLEEAKPLIIVEEKHAFEETPVQEVKATAPEEISKKAKTQKPLTPDLFSTHTSISDKYKDEKKSLNDLHSEHKIDKSLASKLQKNPVKDLKAAIGINEKFKFINKLFEGSLQKYNEGIAALNSFENLDGALKYTETLKADFKWEENCEAEKELHELLMRRYQM